MHRPTHTTNRAKRGFLAVAALLAVALLAAACGDDGGGGGGGEPATNTSDPVSEGDAVDPENTSDDDPVTSDTEDAPSTPAGNGMIVADVCASGQFVNGAISPDDLAAWGLFASSDMRVDGPGVVDATTYNDFGVLCNLEASDGGDFLTVNISAGSESFDDVASRQDGPAISSGNWQYYVVNELTPLMMLHTDADGVTDTLWVTWFPDDDSRRNLDEYQRVLTPLADAIATRTTVDIPRSGAQATPDWFVCDDENVGVAGLSPAALVTLANPELPADWPTEVEQDTNASFGFTQCQARPADGPSFPRVTVQVQDAEAELQDSLSTYLAGWPDATPDTIAGVDVAVRIDEGVALGIVFTVLDGVPTEIRHSASASPDDPPLDATTRAVAELVLSAIS